jgi:hypothetical protein
MPFMRMYVITSSLGAVRAGPVRRLRYRHRGAREIAGAAQPLEHCIGRRLGVTCTEGP